MLIVFIGIILVIFAVCLFSNTSQLLLLPLTTPEKFLSDMPHISINIFEQQLVFIQPSSSILVYGLGVLMIMIGIYFYVSKRVYKSRQYWGIGLFLWGISAIAAGTSYQAFGYELKCAEREFCLFTNIFELVYMLLTAYSINFLVAATGYTSLGQMGRKRLIRFAVVDSILYSIYIFLGALIPIRFLVSYEGFMSFIGVNFIIMFVLNIRHYRLFRDSLNRGFITIWISFLVVNLGYFVFLLGHIGQKIYKSYGVWFNENDALHVLLIIWAIMVMYILRNKMRDITS